MTAGPRLSLIITTYNQPEYLARVLAAVARQSVKPEEVFLADDGSDSRTAEVFSSWPTPPGIKTEHLWQKNEGFRRSRILNEAIARTTGDYLVFLDGDTVPHPEFIADHRRVLRQGAFLQGHRALVSRTGSVYFGSRDFRRDRRDAFWRGQITGFKLAFRWPRPWVRQRRDLRGIRGCNLSLWRDSLVRVNGFNEAFVGWGREDSELAVRLMNLGVRRLDVRGWALCYHLWHPPASRAGLPANDQLLAEAQRSGILRCELGLAQHLPPPP